MKEKIRKEICLIRSKINSRVRRISRAEIDHEKGGIPKFEAHLLNMSGGRREKFCQRQGNRRDRSLCRSRDEEGNRGERLFVRKKASSYVREGRYSFNHEMKQSAQERREEAVKARHDVAGSRSKKVNFQTSGQPQVRTVWPETQSNAEAHTERTKDRERM